MPNSSPIDRAMLERLADLARLRPPTDRAAELLGQLQQVVDAFSALADADLGPLPDDEPVTTPAALREDRPEDVPDADEALANAPQRAADCFVVPRVVEP